MRLLIHVCCAPCLVYPLRALREEGFELRGFFYNPNIQPYHELTRRLEALEGYARKVGLDLIVRPDYPLKDWLRGVAFREEERCTYCYHLRLSAAARLAKKSGYDAFTTTLLYSKRQRHESIQEIGRAAGQAAGVEFFHRDFRSGWAEGRAGAEAAGLYRQNYCGCIYSERDRHYPRRARPRAQGRAKGASAR